ncbi:MAG: AAA family ATPase [Muribaculaceae bacterium]|nr:AAA family ATPase [Muribaculaceae bacterium]
MKIKTVAISDFRSIRNLELECGPGINVIAGINGAGKSTLLDALELGLSWAKARIRQKTAPGAYPEQSDIHRNASVARWG